MRFLKQSTAVDLNIGPFLDATDGITAETALTITQPDVQLSKAGAAFAQKSAAQTLSHQTQGWYQVNLSTTDTNTLGPLMLSVQESGAVPVWHEFHVLAANVYDSLFGSGDVLDVSVTQWLGSAVAAVTQAGVPEVDVTHLGGSAIDQTGGLINANMKQVSADAAAADTLEAWIDAAMVPANMKQVSDDSAAADILELFIETLVAGTGKIQTTTFNAGAIDANAIATDAIGAAELADGAASEIADAVWAKTGSEPGSVPALTATMLAKIDMLYAAFRNKVEQTATQYRLRNDADSGNLATATVSDDGTTFTRGEMA